MVLKACLLEVGCLDDTRHTVDIDANWNSEFTPSTEQICQSFQKAIDRASLGLKVKVYRQYGENRSAGFELSTKDFDEVLFTMDVVVNRSLPLTKLYEIGNICFKGSAPNQIIAGELPLS